MPPNAKRRRITLDNDDMLPDQQLQQEHQAEALHVGDKSIVVQEDAIQRDSDGNVGGADNDGSTINAVPASATPQAGPEPPATRRSTRQSTAARLKATPKTADHNKDDTDAGPRSSPPSHHALPSVLPKADSTPTQAATESTAEELDEARKIAAIYSPSAIPSTPLMKPLPRRHREPLSSTAIRKPRSSSTNSKTRSSLTKKTAGAEEKRNVSSGGSKQRRPRKGAQAIDTDDEVTSTRPLKSTTPKTKKSAMPASTKENVQPSSLSSTMALAKLQHQTKTSNSPSIKVSTGGALASAEKPKAINPASAPTITVAGSTGTIPPQICHPDRNIDKVVLGDMCFSTWYPSYYGKEVLGDIPPPPNIGIHIGSMHHSGATSNSHNPNNSNNTSQHHSFNSNTSSSIFSVTSTPTTTDAATSSSSSTEPGGKSTPGGVSNNNNNNNNNSNNSNKNKEPPAHQMLDRLYVCPCCFKYSRELVAWWGHFRMCERETTSPPGRQIYAHPRESEGENETEGEWSVWEVDGEQDSLFCQNLSLFAKLFLDNKSIFFNVAIFKYYLLVYTPPGFTEPTDTTAPHQRRHIVGFFSKEKMSWDNNNLACILVFPPWQRKGLGALLMGVSYEISRREGIMGGPEKPISELGKKGYKRFWAGEIARWLLTLDISADVPTGTGTDTRSPSATTDAASTIVVRGVGGSQTPDTWASNTTPTTSSTALPDEGGSSSTSQLAQAPCTVDVDGCSKATWIAPDDCLAILREMAVIAAPSAGLGPVQLDKEAVRVWVRENGISLKRVCDPDGFVVGC